MPQIRCTGRNYPNGPRAAMVGCIGRPAPHFFGVSSTPLVGSPLETSAPWILTPWVNNFPLTGPNPISIWEVTVPVDHNKSIRFEVATFLASNVPTIKVTYQQKGTGWPNSFLNYEAVFADGFQNPWVTITIFHLSTAGWPFAIPGSVKLFVPTYDELPADTCLP